MASYGYSYVSDKAFIAFLPDLDEGPWKPISITKLDNPAQSLASAALDAPHPVVWKTRITWAVRALMAALGAGVLDALDADWDGCQRRFFHQLALLADDKEPAVREAAARLQGQLLAGEGTAQTVLDYDAEVDFGRQQILRAHGGAAAGDVKRLKLGSFLEEIDRSTEALAKGLGRRGGKKRGGAPSIQQRDALTACSAAFNAVHGTIDWFVEHTPGAVEKERLVALRAPFEALLARNPPPDAAAKVDLTPVKPEGPAASRAAAPAEAVPVASPAAAAAPKG